LHQSHPNRDTPAPTRGAHGHSFLRFKRGQLALGAMAFTTMMACMPALPASADLVEKTAEVVDLQSFTAAGAALPSVERSDFVITEYSVVNWPVPSSTGVTSGFGPRAAPCDGCSTYHNGVDFTPGAGVPVLAIADGVVTEVGPDGSLGTYLKVQHTIDGQTITSTYAHMVAGSMPYSVGDTVKGGTVVGLVGSTGQSTGAHLYFEIRLGGQWDTAINPLPWLRAHANA
jgi:murein DD-endopeptidase MepM/ murein hydrolase activator NlpD